MAEEAGAARPWGCNVGFGVWLCFGLHAGFFYPMASRRDMGRV